MSRRKVEEHENHERWLVSYADFITLLFAFFVVLYATSTRNEEKERRFEENVRAQFKLVGNMGGPRVGGGENLGGAIDPIEFFKKKNVPSVELEEYIDRLLKQKLTPEERKTAIGGIRHDNVGVRISLASSTFFNSGGVTLRQEALKSLAKIAEVLKSTPNKLIIEGHTDNTPVYANAYESNWELASLRATSVVKYLIKYHNVNPQKLAAISYADQKPLVPNTTEQNKALNRRIEILIVNGDEPVD